MTDSKLKVLAIVPARSGSKGIPHKNIRPFRGKPLLTHAVEQGMAARNVDRVLLSTDSEAYAAIGRAAGADAPFLRPAEFSNDRSTDLEVFTHALTWLEEQEGYRPDICVHLRPTTPLRAPADIDRAVDLLVRTPGADSVRSVVPAPHTPYKMWRRGEDGFLEPFADCGIPEAWNRPRQDLPPVWLHDGCIDVVWSRVIRERHSMSGTRILGLPLTEVADIDTPADWLAAEGRAPLDLAGKTLVVDIDGVIATPTGTLDYAPAGPLEENIRLLRRLHGMGCRIVLFTARGTMTGRDWREVTEAQMKAWGVLYHELHFGKPPADFYLDDKAIRIEEIAAALGPG